MKKTNNFLFEMKGLMDDLTSYGHRLKLIAYLATEHEAPNYPGAAFRIAKEIRDSLGPSHVSAQNIGNALKARGITYGECTQNGRSWIAEIMPKFQVEADVIFAVCILLAAGSRPDIDAIYATLHHHYRSVLLILLDYPVDWNATPISIFSFDILNRVIAMRDLEILQALKKAGFFEGRVCDPDAFGYLFHDTEGPIFLALRFLVEQGYNPYACITYTTAKPTVLHLAADVGCTESIRYLVMECKMDPNAVDKRGRTPLFFALTGETVKILVELGALVDHRCSKNRTPLIERALDPMVCVALLDRGADPNATANSGRTALCKMSPESGYESSDCPIMMDAMLERGAAPLLSPEFLSCARTTRCSWILRVVFGHVRHTMIHVLSELLEHQQHTFPDEQILSKLDIDSTMGDPRDPRSLPYCRLPEWFAALRAALVNEDDARDRLLRLESEWLKKLAKQIELTPAALRWRRNLAKLDCEKYKKMKTEN
jgi:hypothetical protein